MKLDFEEFPLYSEDETTLLYLRRKDPKQRTKIKKKHIEDDPEGAFRNIDGIDFEIALRSLGDDGFFVLDPAHVFSFLLMIRTGGWINAPALLTSSMLEDPDTEAPHIFCTPFIEATPTHYRDVTLTLEDAVWIRENMSVGIRFTEEKIFQNAMQALTSYHCVPYANICLLIAWSGLEALFRTHQELSFRLSLYISNFLNKGAERAETFERLRKSYEARSKVTHGSGGHLKDLREHAEYTRNILRGCLAKCIETGSFPDTKHLVFAD